MTDPGATSGTARGGNNTTGPGMTAYPSFDPATTAIPVINTPASGVSMPSALTPEEVGALTQLPQGTAMLIAHRGAQAGARFLLDADVTTAGRDVAADILLDDRTVSRKHVEIRRDGSGFVLHDRASLNGTYVNGTRVDQAVLVDGDELRIGKFRLTFHAAAES